MLSYQHRAVGEAAAEQAPAKSGASASGGRISDGHTLSDWVPNPKTQPNPGPVRLAPPEILHTFV